LPEFKDVTGDIKFADAEPQLEYSAQPSPRYHRLITVTKGTQQVKFKLYAESSAADITQTIKTRFGLRCSQFVLTDEDGFDVVVDGTLETGTYKLVLPHEETKDDFVLTYFPGRGRAELSRLAFAEAKVPYTFRPVVNSEWPKIKEQGIADGTIPFGQVPQLNNGSLTLVQSQAIARYLARKFNLYGASSSEHALVDMWLDAAEELRARLSKIIWGGASDEKSKSEHVKWAEGWLKSVEAGLARNGKGYIVGNELTIADLALFETIDTQSTVFPSLLDNFAAVRDYLKRVTSRPNIAAYLVSDKRPAK